MRQMILKCILLVLIPVLVHAELIAYYEFESDAKDRSGFGLNADGEFIGTAKITADSVVGNGALELGGYADYVDLGTGSKFNITGEITVSAWIKIQFYAEYCEPFVTKGNSSWRLQRHSQTGKVEFSCSGLYIQRDDKGLYQLYSKTEIDDGEWHHVVGVYDGQRICIYIDGKLDADKPASGKIALNDWPVYIGENAENMGRAFCGCIDSVSIYNKGLSEDQILRLYNTKMPPQTQQIYDVIKEFNLLTDAGNQQQAVEYLEKKIRSLNKLAEPSQHNNRFDSKLYSELLVLLAKAEENVGSDKHQVMQAYLQALNYDPRVTDSIDCYMWLLKNPTAEQSDVFKNIDQGRAVAIAEYFLKSDKYDDFKFFFGTFFDDKYRPAQLGLGVRDVLSSDQQWLAHFDGLFKTKPQWLELSRFKECENEFNAGRYEASAELLETFLNDYKGSAWGFDKDALLLAGQCYVQLGQTEKAYAALQQLIFEYPDCSQTDESSLILGYTYMINNEFDLAKQVFNVMIKTSIKSQYLARANQYLERINLLTQ